MPTHQAKTLVFSFDGTGNEPSDAGAFMEDESITNVLKLHLLLGGGMDADGAVLGDGAGKQLAFYYNGIGTREAGRSIPGVGWLASVVNMTFAPAWGDAKRILREAAADFDSNHNPGDAVAVFGYSRGAALARKFVAQLLRDGKCDKVAFLGVFDTVAAMNGVQRAGEHIASDVLFENGTLHEDVERAVHIVALDEDRVLFRPTLINRDPTNGQRITEIWFPGVHGDIGGGYWHDGLSDGALEFMIGQCRRTMGDGISIRNANRRDDVATLLNDLKERNQELADIDIDDVISRPLVDGPAHAHSGAMVKAGGRAHRHVRVNEDDHATQARPLVHKSVLDRFQKVPGYRPPTLRGLAFSLWDENGCRAPVQGITGLNELAAQTSGELGVLISR